MVPTYEEAAIGFKGVMHVKYNIKYLGRYIYVPAQSRTHIRHEWPGPVGTLIQVGLAWAVHDGYDIIN